MSETTHEAPPVSVWNRELFLIFAVVFLAYGNMSVFFQFYEYLRTLPIDPKWFGLLIGAYSAISLAVRPVVSPLFHSGNARRYLYVGAIMVMAALSFYGLASGFLSMLLVRCFHGLAFVVMGAALMALMIDHIPEGRSAQVFGLLGIVTLLPNTVVPPMLPFLDGLLGGLLPRWFDTDGLLMQKIIGEPCWDGMQIHFDRAKSLVDMVRTDWSATL